MMKKLVLGLFAITLLLSGSSFISARKKKKDPAAKQAKKIKKENKKKKSSAKKNVKKQKRAEKKKPSWWDKLFKKEQKSKAKQQQLTLKAAEKDRAKIARIERKEERYWTRLEHKRQADQRRELRMERLSLEKQLVSEERARLIRQWKEIRISNVEQDYTDGEYADLYKRPAWPFEMLFAEHKDLFQVRAWGNYATSAYTANGSSHDLSKLIFGADDIKFQDLLLALKLYKKDILDCRDRDPWNMISNRYYDKKLLFYGESNEYGVSLDFARYLKSDNFMFGFKIPVAYKSHRLKLDSTMLPFNYDHNSSYCYRAQQAEILNWMLLPKGLSYLPKSSIIGLGDIDTFVNFQFHTKYLERLIFGLNVQWPTAKDPDTSKLWAPQLGNGFAKVSAYSSIMFNKQSWYFNPHMFLRLTYQVEGHKDRRVPKVISYGGDKDGDTVEENVIAHGSDVTFTDKAFTYLDCEIPAFADNVKSVEIRPGMETDLRIGNIFEKFIYRRGFLDVYYNFRAKWRDHVSNTGLPREVWDVLKLRKNTQQLEHKVGLDFSYQFDYQTRFQAGFNWVFAGMNVPEVLEGTLAINVEF